MGEKQCVEKERRAKVSANNGLSVFVNDTIFDTSVSLDFQVIHFKYIAIARS